MRLLATSGPDLSQFASDVHADLGSFVALFDVLTQVVLVPHHDSFEENRLCF